MAVEQIAARHAARQVLLARRAARQLAQLWRQLDPANIAGSWRSMLPQTLAVMVASQTMAAAEADGYIGQVVAGYGIDSDPAGRIQARAFAGVASDGRDLGSLMYEPVINALTNIRRGVPADRALASGGVVLNVIARTQVADAGRTADGAAIAVHRELTGYVRMIVGKTCSRCVLLAGRRYGWSAGFQRHPRLPMRLQTHPGH